MRENQVGIRKKWGTEQRIVDTGITESENLVKGYRSFTQYL